MHVDWSGTGWNREINAAAIAMRASLDTEQLQSSLHTAGWWKGWREAYFFNMEWYNGDVEKGG